MILFNAVKAVDSLNINAVDTPYYEGHTELIELNEDYYNIMREFMVLEYMKESTTMVYEAMSDIFNTIIEWLKKFKNMVINFFKSIFRILEGLFMETEKYFNKYKDSINLKESFKVNIFEYDIDLLKKMPDTKFIDGLVNDFNSMSSRIKSMTPSDISDKTRAFLDDGSLDDIRGKVSTIGGRIISDNFREEVRKALRKGDTSEKEVEITTDKAKTIMSSYGSFKELMKETTKTQTKIISLLDKLEAFFNNGAKKYKETGSNKEYIQTKTLDYDSSNTKVTDKEGDKHALSEHAKIELYYKYFYHQAKNYNEITYICFQEKVNCLKELMKTYRAVGKEAIAKSRTKDGDK